jgi:hypothetical protein
VLNNVEFSEELSETYDSLYAQYDLKMRTVHQVKKSVSGLRHLFEFGSVSRGGIVVEFIIEETNAVLKRGRFKIMNLANRSQTHLRGRLRRGNDAELIGQIYKILDQIFDGFDQGETVLTLLERLRKKYTPNTTEKIVANEFKKEESGVTEALLEQIVQKATHKGAPLKGYRFSPNNKTVLTYRRKDGSIDEQYFLNIKECVAHLKAAYLL